jgi:hypothetical protein
MKPTLYHVDFYLMHSTGVTLDHNGIMNPAAAQATAQGRLVHFGREAHPDEQEEGARIPSA